MKIGISAFAWTSKFEASHLERLADIKSIGLSCVEIPMFDPSILPPPDTIRAAFDAVGLECTVCAILPQSINPISNSSTARRNAIDHLNRCVQSAASMGAKLIGGPLFAPIGYIPEHRPSKEEWSWTIETFDALSDVLEKHDMQLSIEPVNRSETFLLRTALQAKWLCEEIGNPRIGVTLDTFHANIEERNITSAIVTLGHHLKHVHASENDRGILGRGHIPFEDIVIALKAIHYDGYLMIEGFGFNEKEKTSPGWLWASKEITPEMLASEGMGYLSGLLNK